MCVIMMTLKCVIMMTEKYVIGMTEKCVRVTGMTEKCVSSGCQRKNIGNAFVQFAPSDRACPAFGGKPFFEFRP